MRLKHVQNSNILIITAFHFIFIFIYNYKMVMNGTHYSCGHKFSFNIFFFSNGFQCLGLVRVSGCVCARLSTSLRACIESQKYTTATKCQMGTEKGTATMNRTLNIVRAASFPSMSISCNQHSAM